MSLRKKYDELLIEVSSRYHELRSMKQEFIFTSQEDIDNWEFGEYFEVRNDRDGGVFDVFILKIDNEGIHVLESDNPKKKQIIGLLDLSDLVGMISIVELLEIQLKD